VVAGQERQKVATQNVRGFGAAALVPAHERYDYAGKRNRNAEPLNQTQSLGR